ncbi:MAG: hypothetical protein NC346_09060 [Prevotella sp.]|nr:hypothetical protein [Prevotella sp.]MCM1443671.1 hypothetical protein [Muribaculum sp.]MCM1577146.1 hypothetical protein [Bacteroides sp.]
MCLSLLNKWWNVLHKKNNVNIVQIMLAKGTNSISISFLNEEPGVANFRYISPRYNTIVNESAELEPMGDLYGITKTISTAPGSSIYTDSNFVQIGISDTAIGSLHFMNDETIVNFGLTNISSLGTLDVYKLKSLEYISLSHVNFDSIELARAFAETLPEPKEGAVLSMNEVNYSEPIIEIALEKGWTINGGE